MYKNSFQEYILFTNKFNIVFCVQRTVFDSKCNDKEKNFISV